MLDLGLEANVLLLAELELQVDDLLFLPEIRHDGAQLGKLGVAVVCGLIGAKDRCCRRSLPNARRLGVHFLKVVMEQVVLSQQILGPVSCVRNDSDTMTGHILPFLQSRNLLV